MRLSEIGLSCLVAQGYSDKEIARLLSLSVAAVKSRMRRAFRHAKVRNRAEFIAAGRDVLEQIGALKGPGGSKVCSIASFCAYQEYCGHGATGRTSALRGPQERKR